MGYKHAIPINFKVEEILSAYGSEAEIWGAACLWLETHSSRVDELDLLRMHVELSREYSFILMEEADSSMVHNIRLSGRELIPY